MTAARTCSLALLFCAVLAPQTSSAPDPWQPVRFLAGSWEGDVSGQPGSGQSVREYRFVLNNRYLEIRSKSTYPTQPKNPKGEVHEDWGMISYDRSRKAFVLRQFHVEGFVNQYVSEPVVGGTLRFRSEAIENFRAGFRARESYTITGPDSFVERFELAEPGKDFELYSETRFHRKQESRPPDPGNPYPVEYFRTLDAGREPFQRATDLVAALQVSPGDWVADVGAGGGYYSMRLAELAGPEGKVFAEDISDSPLRAMSARLKTFSLPNVEVVKGDADDPKLPADRLAAVLIVDSYHHFTNYQAMLEKILHALKPGGRLVIADYSFTGRRSQARADQLKLHEIDPALVRAEVEQAGFQVVKVEVPFVKWRPGVGNTRSSETDFWLMVAVRPK